jgi:hypothetical protein
MAVLPPKLPEGHPDRELACEEAMEQDFLEAIENRTGFVALHDEAVAVGWAEEEVRRGIRNLAAAISQQALDLEP